MQPGERHDQRKHRELWRVRGGGGEGVSQERIHQPLRELADRDLPPPHELPCERKHPPHPAELVSRAVEFGCFADGKVEPRELADRSGEGSNRSGVFRTELEHVPFETIDVAVEDERAAVGPLDSQVLVEVDHRPSLHRAHFLPELVVVQAGRRTDEPVDTAVDGVSATIPGGADAARDAVHLEDLRAVPVHLSVAAGAEAGDPSADDGD